MTAAPRSMSKTYKVPKVRFSENEQFPGFSELFPELKRLMDCLATSKARERRR